MSSREDPGQVPTHPAQPSRVGRPSLHCRLIRRKRVVVVGGTGAQRWGWDILLCGMGSLRALIPSLPTLPPFGHIPRFTWV